MYGKIFDSIFSSTLVAEGGWLPTYIFISMVALADKDGFVEIAPKALFRRLGFSLFDSKVTFDEFVAAIEYLREPDAESASEAHEGRRLLAVADMPEREGRRGWWIVNYKKYREKGKSTDRVRRHRAAKSELNKNNDLPNGVTLLPFQSVSETYTDTDADIIPPTAGVETPSDPKKELWDQAVKLLGAESRSLVGKQVKKHGIAEVAKAIAATKLASPAEPRAYFLAALPAPKTLFPEG